MEWKDGNCVYERSKLESFPEECEEGAKSPTRLRPRAKGVRV